MLISKKISQLVYFSQTCLLFSVSCIHNKSTKKGNYLKDDKSSKKNLRIDRCSVTDPGFPVANLLFVQFPRPLHLPRSTTGLDLT